MVRATMKTTKETVAQKTTHATSSTRRINEEDIRQRAYEIYCERDRRPGNPLEDWYRAERELKSKRK